MFCRNCGKEMNETQKRHKSSVLIADRKPEKKPLIHRRMAIRKQRLLQIKGKVKRGS